MYKGNKIVVCLDRATNLTKDVPAQDIYLDTDYTVADLLNDNADNKLAINKLQEVNIKTEAILETYADMFKGMLSVMTSNNLDCTKFAEIVSAMKKEN